MADELDAVRAALAASPVAEPEIPRKNFVNRYVLTPLGQTLDVLDTDLNLVTNAIRPLVTGINPNLNEVYDSAPKKFGMPNVVPSDLVEKALERSPARKVLAPVLGFALDIAASPSTYIAGVGVLSKEGKLLQKVKSLSEAGQSIGLESKLAEEIAAHYGEKATPALIGRVVKQAKALGDVPSLEAQAKMGQRALINIGIPFTRVEVPFIKSQLFFRGLDQAGNYLKDSKPVKAFNKLFSTSSGNPVFDTKRLEFLGLARLRKDDVEKFAITFGQEAEKAAKEYGLDRNEFLKMITDIAENPYRGDISAKSMLQTFTDQINNKVIEGIPVERIIRSLPGVDSMVMDERMNLQRSLLRTMKERAAGFDVTTAGFLQLPNNVRNIFVKEWTEGLGIKFARDVKQGSAQYADFAKVFDAYHRGIKFKDVKLGPGLDAGMFALVGHSEYLRMLKHEGEYAKLAKALAIPSGVGTEAASMRDVVGRLVAHIDQGFSTSYSLYHAAPKYLEKVSPRMYKLQQLIDSNHEWKIKGLVEQFGIPINLAKKYPKAFDMAQKSRIFMQNQLQLEQLAGVPISQFIGDISYIPHVPTEEARKLLEKHYGDMYKGAARDWNIDHLSTLARQFKVVNKKKVEEFFNTGLIGKAQRKALLGGNASDFVEHLIESGRMAEAKANELYHFLTVDEVNSLSKLGKLNLLPGVKLDKFFEENPAQQILVRGIRGEKARTAADFYEAVEQFGKWHDNSGFAPEGMKFLTNESANPLAAKTREVIVKIPGGGKKVIKQSLAFDEGIANQIDLVHKALALPPGSHPILNIFDSIQNEWKAWTLSIFPSYHTRNFIGNIWNNYLAGIHTPEPYLKALEIQRGKGKILTGAGQTLKAEEVIELARRNNILNMGQYFGDIERYFEADVSEGIAKVYKNKVKAVPQFGLRLGNHVQNNANMALFIRRLEEGFSAADAAQEVRKFQFDYHNITPFERNVLKRVLPFYSWTRFNIPLQLEAAFTHPQRLLAVAKGRNVLESNYDGVPDERLLPDYYVQNFPIRVRYDHTRKQYEYFLLNSWLPAADIDKIFDPVTYIKNQLTPLLKEPIQQIANRDFFTNREIDTGDNYDTLTIFGKKVSLPARDIHVLKNFRILTELDRLASPDLSTSGKVAKVLTGKLYPLNEDKERRNRNIEFQERRKNLKSELRRARKDNNEGEVKRILNRLRQISEKRAEEVGGGQP